MILELAVTVGFIVGVFVLCAYSDGVKRIRWIREEAERQIADGGSYPRPEGEGRRLSPERPSPTFTRVGAWVRGACSTPARTKQAPRVRLKGAVRGEGPVPARAPRPAPKDAA